ncbi:MAG: type IV pilus modification protein PilV [Dyella sp.]|nr:type IV pilus modification protein PilV [Dyella sp.]
MNSRTSGGYTLLEAMIAVVIISVGLIGFLRLELLGMSATTTSTQRSKAVYLAYEMADRMRANLAGYAASAYSNLTSTPVNPGCVSTSCTSAQIAQNDYYEWSNEVSTLLQQGAAAVCLTSTILATATPAAPGCDGLGSRYAVMIWWTEDGKQQKLVSNFQP